MPPRPSSRSSRYRSPRALASCSKAASTWTLLSVLAGKCGHPLPHLSHDGLKARGTGFRVESRRELLLLDSQDKEAGLCVTRQTPGELSAPDTECAGDNEPEARDPKRSGPPADHRRPMGQHPCEMEQSDECE
jgi:hypothetical protein